MRRIFLQAIVCLSLFSCKKECSNNAAPVAGDLAGKWRMISLKDNSTNITTSKPSSITGDVDIAFTFSTSADGVMDGVTPTNDLVGDYSVSSNGDLSIPSVAATKVMETDWGKMFMGNITYAHDFKIDNTGKLIINASTNKALTFIRR